MMLVIDLLSYAVSYIFKDYFSSNAKAVAKVNIYYLVIEFFKVNIQEICVELNIENELSKRLHYL